MERFLQNPNISKVLTPVGDTQYRWRDVAERFRKGESGINRQSVGEEAIKAIQRMLVFLGYSTSSTGAFAIDGNFGRGTNRAVAQFEFDHGLNIQLTRKILCYPCTWQTAETNIVTIPDTRLSLKTMEVMLRVATDAIARNRVLCGTFEDALFHLNALDRRQVLSCQQIKKRYGGNVKAAVVQVKEENRVTIQPEWVLAIIKQETGGIVRPRFEQHILTRLNNKQGQANLVELRYQAMSQGLGQILGSNYKLVCAESAVAMFQSSIAEQVLFVARFLARKSEIVSKRNPTSRNFAQLARFYNGPGYAKHHYDESLARWFREFQSL
jgi:peptidoglycan hydrolase-like protein with peptidoglycan-binding domain